MPDPVRPVAPREDEIQQLIACAKAVIAEWESSSTDDRYAVRLAVAISKLKTALAVSPVPWAGNDQK